MNAKALALDNMDKHGLLSKGWKFEFDNAKTRFGRCEFVRRRITLSKVPTRANSEADVLDTILHEIAHALEWIRHGTHGHKRLWKLICMEIGARPVRCGKVIDPVEVGAPFTLDCTSSSCNNSGARWRKTRTRFRCGVCSAPMKLVHTGTTKEVYPPRAIVHFS